jgi:alkaline phosphatase
VNLPLEAKKRGYKLVVSRAQLSDLKSAKVLGLFAGSSMQSAFADGAEPRSSEPSLKEMTEVTLSKLSVNEQGFFLIVETGQVEAGQIDWAGHANDVGWLLKEMQRIGGVLELISDWMKDRSDTLLVVTADHETGSFGFSYHVDDLPPPIPFPGMPQGTFYQPTYNFVPEGVLSTIAQQRKLLRHILACASLLEPRGEKVTEEGVARPQRVVRVELGVSLSRTEAFQVLAAEPNTLRLKAQGGHVPSFVPRIDDFDGFYARLDGRLPNARDDIAIDTIEMKNGPVVNVDG